jgi:hypothetical protein
VFGPQIAETDKPFKHEDLVKTLQKCMRNTIKQLETTRNLRLADLLRSP